MKKKAVPLVVLASALIVCLAAYFAVTSANRRGEEDAAKKAAESLLYKNGRGDPVTVSFGAGGGAALEFALDGGVWRYTAVPDFPLTQSYVTRVAASLNTLAPDSVIATGLPLGDYGLSEPSYTLTASDGASEPFTLIFGNKVGEFIYAMRPGGDEIYTVRASLADFLGVGLYDMVTLETMPAVETERMTALTAARGDAVFSAELRGIQGENVWVVTSGGQETRIDGVPTPDGGDRSAKRYLDAALNALAAPAFAACADWRAPDGALEAYGLAAAPPGGGAAGGGALTVGLTFMSGSGFITEEKSYTLLIGGEVTDGDGPPPDGADSPEREYRDRYARLDGSEFINTLPASVAQPLIELFETLHVKAISS
ncbi:MAG: DUF4340 domain-containing protein [Oscillospiraceae bacterium]|jgi:hypothetical protein|nr:DUF4340 domain-containing protein [Oscillospiraceae bacterium]